MKKQLLLMAAALMAWALQAQSWTNLHPLPPQGLSWDGSRLYKVVLNANLTNDGYALMYSDDEGATWADNTTVANQGTRIGYTVFVTSTGRLVTSRGNTSFEFIYSDDQGATWTAPGASLLDNLGWAAETNGVIYAKSFTSGAARYSTDNGSTWTGVPAGTSGQVGGADAGEFYVRISDSLASITSGTMTVASKYALPETGGRLKTFGQQFFHLKNGKVYHSTDKQTWAELTSHPVFAANAMEDVAVSGGDIFLIGHKGLYKTSDGGTTWSNPGGDSLPFLKVILTDNYVIGGYNFGNVGYTYRLGNGGSTGADGPQETGIGLYPNPTRGGLRIETKGIVPREAVAYDLTGREVARQQGSPALDAIDLPLPAGTYLLRLTDAGGAPLGTWRIVKE